MQIKKPHLMHKIVYFSILKLTIHTIFLLKNQFQTDFGFEYSNICVNRVWSKEFSPKNEDSMIANSLCVLDKWCGRRDLNPSVQLGKLTQRHQ